MSRRIGLVVGDQESFSKTLLERLGKASGIEAELARIGATPERFVPRYDVLFDRISHRIPHYRSFLRAAALAGARVVNDPGATHDRFVALSTAAKIGLHTPRAVLLPQKRYAPPIDPERALVNLEYPLRWNEATEYVGLPGLVRRIDRGLVDSVMVRDMEGLLAAYDASGEGVMMLQQHLEGRPFVRCVCVGDKRVVPLEVDTLRHVFVHHDDDSWLSDALFAQIERDASALSRELGCPFHAVDMKVVDGVAHVLDAADLFPDLRRELIGERPFERIVDATVDLLVRAAHGEP
jgi:hypothetical protein